MDGAALNALHKLVEAMEHMSDGSQSKSKNVEIVFAFDEVHTLAEERTNTIEMTKLRIDHLNSAMNVFLRSPIFFVVLSTQSDLRVLAPPAHLARSSRLFNGHGLVQAPLTEVPFDCFCTIDVSKLELNMLHDPIFMSIFGRPL